MFDATQFRSHFPALNSGRVYLDSAATALKPQIMIDTIHHYYSHNSCSINRGHYNASLQTTILCEQARNHAAQLINANPENIIWTSGTTASINLVAQTFVAAQLNAGDEIIVSEFEHHSNLIPWQIAANKQNLILKKWAITEQQCLDLDWLKQAFSSKTKLLAITQMSNVTGYEPTLATIIELAHRHNCAVLVDGAQGVIHHPLNVLDSNVDFYCFSAHKLYGPTGLGILYTKKERLTQMPIWQGGGKMVNAVSFSDFEPASAPARFEAGTPNIVAILGFGAVLDWLKTVDYALSYPYTQQLANYAKQQLSLLSEQFICYQVPSSPLLTFRHENLHITDLTTLIAEQGIELRSGQLCAHPLMQALNINGVLRASFAPYNQKHDVDQLMHALRTALSILEE